MKNVKKNKFWKTGKYIFAVLFLMLVVLSVKLFYDQQKNELQNQELARIYEENQHKEEPKTSEGNSEKENTEDPLKKINSEYLGWLKIDGTQVDLPVVLGQDNAYYLTHDFYKNNNPYGCLFADCTTDLETGNLLIYGHHMKDGSMFGELKTFKDPEFLQDHSIISWSTGDTEELYEVFAVLVVAGNETAETYFPIHTYLKDMDQKETETFLTELKKRSGLWKELHFSEDDKYLFLMTCDYTEENGRLLLCAVKRNERVLGE